MPDGFEPHMELQRAVNLRDLMTSCRQRVPTIIAQMDEMLAMSHEDLPPAERIKLFDMIFNRGYGKPRQHVIVSDPNESSNEKKVHLYIPDNGRQPRKEYNNGPVIDVEGQEA